MEITGDPDVSLTFKGLQPESVAEGLKRNPGVVATANHCVSAIPYVSDRAGHQDLPRPAADRRPGRPRPGPLMRPLDDLRFSHLVVGVTDMERALDFYGGLLGMDVVFDQTMSGEPFDHALGGSAPIRDVSSAVWSAA